MRIMPALAFFGLFVVACDSGSQSAAPDCSQITCDANEICNVGVVDERCNAACDIGDGEGCVCQPIEAAYCMCAPGTDQLSDGSCVAVTTGYDPFTAVTVNQQGNVFSITSAAGATACAMVSSVATQPLGAASQIIITGTDKITECALPRSRDSYMPSNCAWFRSWDDKGNLVMRDAAVTGAVRFVGIDQDGYANFQEYEVELRFSSGATYVDTIRVDLDHDYRAMCTQQ